MIKLAVKTKPRVENVAVSAIFRRADSAKLDQKTSKVNQLVEKGLKTSEISCIKHDNIQNGHLENWIVQLNTNGWNILTGNFIYFLRGNRIGHANLFKSFPKHVYVPFPLAKSRSSSINLQSVRSLSSVNNSIPPIEPSSPSYTSTDISVDSNDSSDIGKLFSLRTEYHNHPLIGFLNISSLRNKIIDLTVLMERCLTDVLVIEETKINSDSKTESFLVSNYQKHMRRERNEFGGGFMLYARKSVV